MSESIIVVAPADIAEIVSQSVRQELARSLPEEVRKATTKPYLTKTELMQLTGWSSRQVEYRKANRSIPFIRRGRTILFPTDEIYAFLEEGRVDRRS